MMSMKGFLREDPWATPLLSMCVATLCAYILYIIVHLCSRKRDFPWTQMPLLLGFITLTSTSIICSVPLNNTTCRLLCIGPGIGYTLVISGLLFRVVQYLVRGQSLLQWLLLFFIMLNQFIISVSYLLKLNQCQLNCQDTMLILLYPALLVGISLFLVYRVVRKSRSKVRDATYIGLAASFTAAVAVCWTGAAFVSSDANLPICIGYGTLATTVIVSMITLIPKHYDKPYTSQRFIYANSILSLDSLRRTPAVRKKSPTPSESTEPDVIIVPVAADGGIPATDMAMQAIRAHRKQQQRQVVADRSGSSRRRPRPVGWNNKISADSPSRSRKYKRRESRRKAEPKMTRNHHQVPYNHRGWLY